jgi:hypothetical protein
MNEQEQDTIDDQSTLCDRCRNISVEAIWDVDGYIIQPDIQSLVASSEYCRLCAIVKLQIWNAIKTISKLGSPGMSTEVSLCKHEDQDKVWIRIFEQPWRLKLGVLQFYKTSSQYSKHHLYFPTKLLWQMLLKRKNTGYFHQLILRWRTQHS